MSATGDRSSSRRRLPSVRATGAARCAATRAADAAATRAVVDSFCFGIEPWNADTVEAELKKRGLAPVADNEGNGFESFHVKDPDGFDLQISNGDAPGIAQDAPASAKLVGAGCRSSRRDGRPSGSIICRSAPRLQEERLVLHNLLGWKPTYDEGSQNECMIGDIGDIIIRGGNPLDPNFGKRRRAIARSASITSRSASSRGIPTA